MHRACCTKSFYFMKLELFSLQLGKFKNGLVLLRMYTTQCKHRLNERRNKRLRKPDAFLSKYTQNSQYHSVTYCFGRRIALLYLEDLKKGGSFKRSSGKFVCNLDVFLLPSGSIRLGNGGADSKRINDLTSKLTN